MTLTYRLLAQLTVFMSLSLGNSIYSIAQQSPNRDPKITVAIPACTLPQAISLLSEVADVDIAFERSLLNSYSIKQQNFTNQRLSTIILSLLANTNIELVLHQGNFLITRKKRQDTDRHSSPANQTTLSGYVQDSESGERLVGATILLNGSTATTTNNYGYFSITVPSGDQEVHISMVGYQALVQTIALDENVHRTFEINQQTIVLDDVEINVSVRRSIQQETQMGKVNLSVRQIQAAPRFMGEADVLKTLQLLPGVQQGSEGTSALLVRGGSPDQNLFLLDGTPLYNPSHLLGIFSTFNTSTLKNVDLYKGAFPARFGGRLSSVIDITTKDGHLYEYHGDFSIGLLASQFTLEGPIKKGKTSLVLSGRRTYADLLAQPFRKHINQDMNNFALFFHDLNLKLHHKFSDDDRIFFSLYSGRDYFNTRIEYNAGYMGESDWYSRSREDMGLSWGNHTGTLRWNHIFGPKLFANISLIGSQYQFNTSSASVVNEPSRKAATDNKLSSGIRDFGLKVDFDYRPHPDHAVKAGIGATNHRFTPGSTSLSYDMGMSDIPFSVSQSTLLRGSEVNAYAEDEWNLTSKLSLNLGIHASGFVTEGRTYAYAQPRISGRFLLPGDIAFKASYAQMAQYMHLLSNNTISLPTDLWVPATDRIKPQLSQQVSAGFARGIMNNVVDLSVEGYYKNMNNVIEYREGEAYFAVAGKDWEQKVTSGNGRAYGVEFFAHKKTGRLNGWAGYAWAKTNRQINGINFDRRFPYKYDRRHEFKAFAAYRLSKGIHFSGSLVYQSAMPFTISLGEYEGIADPTPLAQNENPWGIPSERISLVNSRNNTRLESYHRLDLSIDFIRIKRSGTERTWNISVYNAYNRKNPFSYYPDGGLLGGGNSTRLMRLTLLPILPSISYRLKF